MQQDDDSSDDGDDKKAVMVRSTTNTEIRKRLCRNLSVWRISRLFIGGC